MAHYPFPWGLFFSLVAAFPHPKRSLLEDARTMHRRIVPEPRVQGEEHLPLEGPCLIVANHYQRRGVWIGWPGAVISSIVADRRGQDPPVCWLVTGGIRLLQHKNRGPRVPGSGAMLRSVARTYGMTALSLNDQVQRASNLRSWLTGIDRGCVLGMFPEGVSGKTSRLSEPSAGFDRVCALVCRKGCPILPTGIYEEGDALHISFGELLPPPRCADARLVMRSIAQQLPSRLRGTYREDPKQQTVT
jgi:hypothetical protein